MINVLLTKLAISYASCLELICDLQVTEMCLTLFTVLCLLWGINVLSLEIHCLLTPVLLFYHTNRFLLFCWSCVVSIVIIIFVVQVCFLELLSSINDHPNHLQIYYWTLRVQKVLLTQNLKVTLTLTRAHFWELHLSKVMHDYLHP